jgi:hypothetical protein
MNPFSTYAYPSGTPSASYVRQGCPVSRAQVAQHILYITFSMVLQFAGAGLAISAVEAGLWVIFLCQRYLTHLLPCLLVHGHEALAGDLKVSLLVVISCHRCLCCVAGQCTVQTMFIRMVAQYVSGYMFGYAAYGCICAYLYPGRPKVARITCQNLRGSQLDTLVRVTCPCPCPCNYGLSEMALSHELVSGRPIRFFHTLSQSCSWPSKEIRVLPGCLLNTNVVVCSHPQCSFYHCMCREELAGISLKQEPTCGLKKCLEWIDKHPLATAYIVFFFTFVQVTSCTMSGPYSTSAGCPTLAFWSGEKGKRAGRENVRGKGGTKGGRVEAP